MTFCAAMAGCAWTRGRGSSLRRRCRRWWTAAAASGIQVAPTFGKRARLGTDPWSFAAPSADGVPFLLDMATTTVAAGRIRNKANEKLPAPDGWVLDRDGRPSNDPLVARQKGGFLTSLGGSPENSSYK